MNTADFGDEKPNLHPIRVEKIPYETWNLAGIECLPDGWVNVRIWSYDRTLNCDLYVTEHCPGVLHLESSVTEILIQYADDDGEIYDQYSEPYDEHPTLVAREAADPPHKHREFVDLDWQPAYKGGGYLGTCPLDLVRETLAEHGFPDAIPRPDGWIHPDDDPRGELL